MGVAVNEQPKGGGRHPLGHTEKMDFSDNVPMDVPLLDLMKDNSGYDRTFKRYRVNFPMLAHAVAEEAEKTVSRTLAPESRAGTLPGLAHNLSLSGIGFVCCIPFDPGSLVEIEITLEAKTYPLLTRIRWRRQLDMPGETMYHYGAQFLRTEAVLQFIPVAAAFLLTQSGGHITRHESSMTPAMSPMQ